MSGSVNKAIILGNLGADPEVRYTASGQAVGEMRIATTDSWTDKSGQKKEQTEWHKVTVWGKTAEHCKTYLKKGRQVYVEGRIQTEQWEDKKTGEKRYTTRIVAEKVQFLGGGEGGGSGRREDSGRRGTVSHDDREPSDYPPADDEVGF